MKKRVLTAMSGGVDSAAAAVTLLAQGYDCIGCTMLLRDCQAADADDAQAAAERLGMPFHVFDLRTEFREEVILPFAESYLRGETPNPCLSCNRRMKFGRLLDFAAELGCEYVATGHYARVTASESGFLLQKGIDTQKDQSYVLYMLTQQQLSHILLPLGSLTKPEVRRIAAEAGLSNAQRKESQDICFVPDGDYARVVESVSGAAPKPGDFTDTSGRVIGRHSGVIHYTVGQRRGLGIALGKPAYVVRIDAAENRVVIGSDGDLHTDTVHLRSFHMISGILPDKPVRCSAKIRYRHSAQPAWLTVQPDGTAVLRFDGPQRAPAPGQAAVCYDGETVLGGGEITACPAD